MEFVSLTAVETWKFVIIFPGNSESIYILITEDFYTSTILHIVTW
jgi:hypothetical protein